jgi:CRP-like cAMP-binding protein
MSVALLTSETGIIGFRPAMDSEAKGPVGDGLPVADPGSTDTLNGNWFFSKLSEPSIFAINQIAHVGRRPEGTILFLEGDTAQGVCFPCEGRANVLMQSMEGKAFILNTAMPGDVLGLSSVLGETPHEVTVETPQPSRFAFVARGDFLKFLNEHSDAFLYFAQLLSQECHSTYDVIRSMCDPVSKRLARFLMTCNTSPANARALIEKHLPAVAARIRRSLQPKRVLSVELQELGDCLREAKLGCPFSRLRQGHF